MDFDDETGWDKRKQKAVFVHFVHIMCRTVHKNSRMGVGRMPKRRTLQEYRAIDLTMFAGMMVIFEFVVTHAANFWFPGQPFMVSLAAALTSIVYMRWNYWGGVHAVLSGIVFCFFSGATAKQYLVYCIGNLLSLLAVLALKKLGKERVRTGSLALVFPAAVLFLMWTGRALVALLLGAPLISVIDFYTTDSLSLLFTLVIIWMARRLDGIYEDQKHYLLRLKSEKK